MSEKPTQYYLWGNPKQNVLTRAEATRLGGMIAEVSRKISNPQLGWAPAADYRGDVARLFKNSRALLGAQTIGWARSGNYTGGISPLALQEDKTHFAILHHLERQSYGEESKNLNRQIEMCHTHGIIPVLCVGPQKGKELSESVLLGTLRIAFQGLHLASINETGIIFAYEAGVTKGPEQYPERDEVATAFKILQRLIEDHFPDLTNFKFFYSGNVTLTNLPYLKDLKESHPRFCGLLADYPSAAEEFLEVAKNWATDLAQTETPMEASPEASRKRKIETIRTPKQPVKVVVIGGGEIGNDFIGGIDQRFHNIQVLAMDNHKTSRTDSAAKLWKDAYLSHGLFSDDVTVDGDYIVVDTPNNKQRILYLNSSGKPTDVISNMLERNIKADVCLVAVEKLMKERANMTPFIESGVAKYVIASSNTEAADVTIIPGYNQDEFNPEMHKILSISSCGGEAGVLTLSPLADHLGKEAFRLISVIMLHSKTNSMYVGNKGRDPKKEEILGNISITSTGFEKVIAAPGFFEKTIGGVMAFSSRIPTEKTSVAVMLVGLQPSAGASVTKKYLQDIYIEACKDPQYEGILRYDENPSGTKYYVRSRHMAHILGPMIQVVKPTLLGKLDTEFSILGIPFLYGNVPGYGEQMRKMMMLIGQALYGVKNSLEAA